jgi:hypothetical protein
MKKVAIHRSTEEYDPENVDSFNPAALAMHLYPFSTIGPLTSHIHPHFVVFSAGEKLAKLTSNHPDSDALLANFAKIASFGHEGSTEEVIKQNLESLLTIVEIHEQWTSQRCPQLSDRPKHEWLRRPKEAKVTKKKKSKKSKKPQAE